VQFVQLPAGVLALRVARKLARTETDEHAHSVTYASGLADFIALKTGLEHKTFLAGYPGSLT
jgi:hypothetical protein